ncbi:hypothetical protein WJX81_008338 [Elliptochloris bilobata]|uniref:Inositol polyphosphate-related phosphatase domain-containing protein n=1 Tax=Elliptochloris bilobata TaxID=381761 RepID=A0AAW1S485_9CHLO
MKAFFGLKEKAGGAMKSGIARVSSIKRPFSDNQKSAGSRSGSSGSLASEAPAAPIRTPPPAGACAEDLDPVLVHLLRNARSEAVRREFRAAPAGSYTERHDVTLLAGTYNVNGRLPPPALDLRPWLDAGAGADIVAVAFQECVPLSASNVVMGASLDAAAAWDRLIELALNGAAHGGAGPLEMGFSKGAAPSSAAYVQVAGKQMVGVYLSVWVHRRLLPAVRGVQVTAVGTGVLGYMGNKGAVAARLRVHDSGVCLVAAHLSSGQAEGDELRRNYDYAEVVRRGCFPPEDAAAFAAGPCEAMPSGAGPDAGAQQLPGVTKVAGTCARMGQWGAARGLLEHEHLVWMGDLNYRLSLPDPEVRALLRAGDLAALAESDELTRVRHQGRAFEGWAEGPLNFAPTYKFRRGTSVYVGEADDEEDGADLGAMAAASFSGAAPALSEHSATSQGPAVEKEKLRTPAWTDRVLWRPHSGAAQLSYGSCCALTLSDHRPVAATFLLQTREYVRDRVDAELDASRRRVDALEMAALPRCELQPTLADAGTVLYAAERVVRLRLCNTGQVAAQWAWVPLPGAMLGDEADAALRIGPRWADLEPEGGEVLAGEAADLRVRIYVTGGSSGTADLLASAQACQLDAVLVLRIQGGNDIFCSIAGAYAPSFFGVALPTLAGLPRPLIALGTGQGADPARVANGSDQACSTAEPAALRVRLRTPPGAAREPPPTADSSFYSPSSSMAGSPFARDAGGARAFSPAADGAAAVHAAAPQPLPSEASDPWGFAALQLSGDPAPAVRAPGREPLAAAEALKGSLVGVPGRGASSGNARGGNACVDAGPRASESDEAMASLPVERGPAADGICGLVPPELRALTAFLRSCELQLSPAVFLAAADAARAASADGAGGADGGAPPHRRPSGGVSAVAAVHAIREALDRGEQVPEGTTAQSAAATLLAFFAALPWPLMPPAAMQVCEVCVPSASAAASLLADALSPAEWAVFRHVTGLFREALAAAAAPCGPLAVLLAELWFPPAMPGFGCAGRGLRPEDVAGLQRLAEGFEEVAARRAAFVALFLDPDGAL